MREQDAEQKSGLADAFCLTLNVFEGWNAECPGTLKQDLGSDHHAEQSERGHPPCLLARTREQFIQCDTVVVGFDQRGVGLDELNGKHIEKNGRVLFPHPHSHEDEEHA